MNNQYLYETLFSDLGKDATKWGYGMKRIWVEIPESMKNAIPFTFTSMGFKSEQGEYFVGLRMNVDQRSPIKFRKYTQHSNIVRSWCEMLKEFFKEYNIHRTTEEMIYRVV